jgi:DNA-binding phage protein
MAKARYRAHAFEAAKYRYNPKMIAAYLNDALATGGPHHESDRQYGARSRYDKIFAEGRVAS